MRRRITRPRSRLPRLALLALASLVGLFAAGDLAAYTIHLKDGSSIVAKKKYTIQGDKAILVLPSGTETALPLAEIDVALTEANNQDDIGTAIVIENGKATNLTQATPPPKGKQTLKDLLQERAAGQTFRKPGEVVLDATPGSGGITRPPTSHTGQAPLRDVPLSTEIRTFIFGRGITNLEVQQGASSRKPRLVFQTSSETQVFRALKVSAGALIAVREKFPGQVESVELLCAGPAGGSGGRFSLTPPQAADLVAGRIDLPTYFVQNVEF